MYWKQGEKLMYVVHERLYVYLNSDFLFYLKIVMELEETNVFSYDLCMVKKMINSGQMALILPINDFKISHRDENEVSKMINWLKSIYSENTRVSRRDA